MKNGQIYLELNNKVRIEKIKQTLLNFFKDKPFVKVLNNDTFLSTNDVINTNNCM